VKAQQIAHMTLLRQDRNTSRAYNYTDWKWHGWDALRRGFATTLHAAGVQHKIIQELMRHSSLSVTMSYYVKALPATNLNAVRRLGNSFGQRKR
jgi:integrase